MTLIQANIIGTKCWNIFKMDDGTTKNVPCTQDEYDALGLPDAPQPVIEGGSWSGACGGAYLFDTDSGDLESGHYAPEGDHFIVPATDGRGYIQKTREEIDCL